MQVKPVHILLALLVAAGIGTGISYFYRGETGPTPAELADLALNAATVKERTAAAAALADYGQEALPALRRVLNESTVPDVQATSIEGLAKLWDYESMDLFLELAEKGVPRVRGRAAVVVMRMTGRYRQYKANAPESERRILVQHMRDDWDEIKAASADDRAELQRRLKESHENRS